MRYGLALRQVSSLLTCFHSFQHSSIGPRQRASTSASSRMRGCCGTLVSRIVHSSNCMRALPVFRCLRCRCRLSPAARRLRTLGRCTPLGLPSTERVAFARRRLACSGLTRLAISRTGSRSRLPSDTCTSTSSPVCARKNDTRSQHCPPPPKTLVPPVAPAHHSHPALPRARIRPGLKAPASTLSRPPWGEGASCPSPVSSAARPACNPGPCLPPCARSSRTCTRILLCPASGVLPPHPRHSCLSSGGRLMIVPSCTYTPVKRLSNSGALAPLVSTSPPSSCNSL